MTSRTSEISTPPEIAVESHFHARHGSETFPVFLSNEEKPLFWYFLSIINNVYLYRFRLKLIELIFVTCGWGLFCTNFVPSTYLFIVFMVAEEICHQKYPRQS